MSWFKFYKNGEHTFMDVPGGTGISTACQAAAEHAFKEGKEVRFVFNDQLVIAHPPLFVDKGCERQAIKALANGMLQSFQNAVQKRTCDWQHSPEGRRQIAAQIRALIRVQAEMRRLLRRPIPKRLETHVAWTRRFIHVSDVVGVNYNPKTVIRRLEKSGFTRSKFVGRPEEEFKDPVKVAHYYIGQVLDFLYRGSPVHPGIMARLGAWLREHGSKR